MGAATVLPTVTSQVILFLQRILLLPEIIWNCPSDNCLKCLFGELHWLPTRSLSEFWGPQLPLEQKDTLQFSHCDRMATLITVIDGQKHHSSSHLLVCLSSAIWLALAKEMLAEIMHRLEMDLHTEVSFSLCSLCLHHHSESIPPPR